MATTPTSSSAPKKRAPRKPKAEAASKPQLQRPRHVRAEKGEIPPLPPIRNMEPKAESAPSETKQTQVSLPLTHVGLVVGLDVNGNIYHTFVGDNVNIIQLAGLQKYADALIASLINKVLPANAR